MRKIGPILGITLVVLANLAHAQTMPATTRASTLRHADDSATTPQITVTVNFADVPEVPAGWPLIIRANIIAPEGASFPFAPSDVSLKITDAVGNEVPWPLKPATVDIDRPTTRPLATKITASDDQIGTVTFTLADTSAVPIGTYQIMPTLNGAQAKPEHIKIIAAPAKLTDAQQAQHLALGCKSALALGDPDTAITLAEARLATSKRDVLAWQLKADALCGKGNRHDATAAYLQALNLYRAQNPKSPEPPTGLLDSLRHVQQESDKN